MGPIGVGAPRFFHLDGWNGWHFTAGVPRDACADRGGLSLPRVGLPRVSLARPVAAVARGLAFDRVLAPFAVSEDRSGFCLIGGRAEPPPACWGLSDGASHRLGPVAIDARGRLFVSLPDAGEIRVLRLSPPGEITRLRGLRAAGLAVDARGRLFVLDDGQAQRRSYAAEAASIGLEIVRVACPGADAMAVSREGIIAVVASGADRVLLGREGGPLQPIHLGSPTLPALAFDPAHPASERGAILYVADQLSGRVVRWQIADGAATPAAWSEAIDAWGALAVRGDAVVGLGRGCAARPITLDPAGFYAREVEVVLGPLDAEIPETEWHRVTALLDAPPSRVAGVRAALLATDDRDDFDPAATDDPRWTAPRELVAPRPGRPAELALIGARGRYAWLRLTLHGDGRHTPRVRWVRVEHPRDSYLRLLPDIYSEDPEGRDFTARLLSIVEAEGDDLSAAIRGLRLLFTPLSADPELLPWLAERLDFLLEPSWPVEKRREVLARVIGLYRRRGTRAAFEQMLAWYGGPGIRVVEGFQTRARFVLGPGALAGGATVLPGGGPPPPMRLGRDVAFGATRLDSSLHAPLEPLLPGRGEIRIYLPPALRASPERLARITRLAELEAPAGAEVRVFADEPRVALGHGRIGVDAALGRRTPWRLAGEGEPGAFAEALLARGAGADLTLGIGPRLGMDSKL